MTAEKKVLPQRRPLLSQIAIALTIITISACLGGCDRKERPPSGPPDKVTIAFTTLPYTAITDLAQAQGYFQEAGLTVTAHYHSTGKAALDEVLEGKADLATVAETPFMFAVMNEAKISIIATIQRSNRTNAIIAKKDKEIQLPQDLKEKRIAATLKTTSEYFLHAFLATHSLAGTDVRLVYLKPEEILQALAKGEIDAASVFPPFLSQAQQQLGENGITFFEKDIYTQTFNVVVAQDFIRKNPAIIRKALLAMLHAEEFIKENPGAAQNTVADFRQADKETFRAAWSDHIFEVSLDQSLILALEDESRWAIRNRLTNATKVPNYLNAIYLDGLRAVKPDAVRILR